MGELGLVACQPRLPTRDHRGRRHRLGPDLVARDFTADAPGTKLVGDITYSAQLAVMCHPVVVSGRAGLRELAVVSTARRRRCT